MSATQPTCLLILPPVRREDRQISALSRRVPAWTACAQIDDAHRGATEREAVQATRDALAANLAEVDAYLASLPA